MKDKGWRDEPEADRPRGQHGEGLAFILTALGKGLQTLPLGECHLSGPRRAGRLWKMKGFQKPGRGDEVGFRHTKWAKTNISGIRTRTIQLK